MPRILLLTLLAVSFCASAIVIRHDVDDSKYQIQATEFSALADMPGEEHGVLIALQWVITAAHAITWQADIKQITIGGISRWQLVLLCVRQAIRGFVPRTRIR